MKKLNAIETLNLARIISPPSPLFPLLDPILNALKRIEVRHSGGPPLNPFQLPYVTFILSPSKTEAILCGLTCTTERENSKQALIGN